MNETLKDHTLIIYTLIYYDNYGDDGMNVIAIMRVSIFILNNLLACRLTDTK